jgi:hypothetical protein
MTGNLVALPMMALTVSGYRSATQPRNEKRGLEVVFIQMIQHPHGIVGDPGGTDAPILPIHHAAKAVT